MKLAQKLAINYIRAKLNILAVVSKKKAAEKAFEIFCTPVKRSKRKKAPDIFDKGEKLTFDLYGLEITGYRWNTSSARKVLIVHGFESNSKNFDRYIVPLVRKGYEVMAFDAPAHGRSGGKQLTLPLYVKTISTINEFYGPIRSFLAHSLGGLAVAHFLEIEPHDPTTRVVLVAPATETTTAIDSFFHFLQLGDDVRKEFDQLIYEKGGYWPTYYSIRRAMKNISAQVLWFHDEDDDTTPLKDALLVKNDQHPNIEFVITNGFGHRKIYRENKVVKRAIDFL